MAARAFAPLQKLEQVHIELLKNSSWQTLDFVAPADSAHVVHKPAKRVVLAFRAFGGDYGIGIDVEEVRSVSSRFPFASTRMQQPLSTAVVCAAVGWAECYE